MEVRLGCIVEGHGEVEAVPVLIRRIAARLDPAITLSFPPPLRVPKDKLIRPGELERAVELTARKLGGQGAILVVLDGDDDCPAELAPKLLERAIRARGNLLLAVVLAKREFEAWFLASAESLRGAHGLASDLAPPPDPEGIRGAKEWLSDRMESSRQYVETLDQPALANGMDLDLARKSASFDKFYRDVVRLLTGLPRSGAPPRQPSPKSKPAVRRVRR